MTVNDDLFSINHFFLSPEIVQKFSYSIGEPFEKTKKALRTAIPELISGIVSKGSTPEGALSVANMAQERPLCDEISINAIRETNITQGNDFLNGIFGSNLTDILQNIQREAEIKRSSALKMLCLATPVMMEFIRTKLRREGISAGSVMHFLNQQRMALIGFFPRRKNNQTSKTDINHYLTKKNPYLMILFIVLFTLAGIWWLLNQQGEKLNFPQTLSISKMEESEALPLNELRNFLTSTHASQLPQRFRFHNLYFQNGTTKISHSALNELDYVANVMKENPTLVARVEGHTDSLGEALANQDLALRWATAVKKQLVIRGVEDTRIEVVGLGPGVAGPGKFVDFVITDLR